MISAYEKKPYWITKPPTGGEKEKTMTNREYWLVDFKRNELTEYSTRESLLSDVEDFIEDGDEDDLEEYKVLELAPSGGIEHELTITRVVSFRE